MSRVADTRGLTDQRGWIGHEPSCLHSNSLGSIMSLLGFFLVLAAAFCHATWNYFLKRISAGAELEHFRIIRDRIL